MIRHTHFKPFFAALVLLVTCGNSQTSTDSENAVPVQTTVIDIEQLTPPDSALPTIEYSKILDTIIHDYGDEGQKVVASNRPDKPLVSLPHPFFDGMHIAYADHRSFVLSPDALWLLICQGFTHHVNLYAEELRPLFVDFDGKRTLTVLDDGNTPWERHFQTFADSIARYVGDSLVRILTCDFTTSTPVTRTASQVTIMATAKKYFNYTMFEVCGIPQVILEGTPEDWQKIIDRVQWLRRYDLSWWVDEMLPVLQKIERAAEGEVDVEFWRGMYKQHDAKREMCGDPYVIADGWVVKFYPYDEWDPSDEIYNDWPQPKEHFRNDLQSLQDGSDATPPEIVSAPLEYHHLDGHISRYTLWAGFVGLSQDAKTLALRPEIGWFISK